MLHLLTCNASTLSYLLYEAVEQENVEAVRGGGGGPRLPVCQLRARWRAWEQEAVEAVGVTGA